MKKISLTAWIFIALVLGVLVGYLYPDVGKEMKILSTVFIKMVKSIVAPLLFATLVFGIAGGAHSGAMGRIGIRAVIYFEVVTTIALFVGLGFVNFFQPGKGVDLSNVKAPEAATAKVTWQGIIEHTFPASIIDSMAKNDVLQVVVFAMMFGMACAAIGLKAKPVVEFCEGLSEVMFKYTAFVMYAAPLGVFGAMAATVGQYGVKVLFNLAQLVLTMFGALAFFVIIVLGAVILIAKIPLGKFIRAVKDPYILAFSTASSEAALPMALANMERFGVPKHIVSFVMPLGYSLNLDGSTLYLAAASIFVAQAAGIELGLGQQIMMMLTLMLTSKGVAAVPRASLVILMGTLATFGLPTEPVALILGVDAVLDMARTSVNLLGNCLASAVVARWEGVDLNGPETVKG
ncbi:MAG: cation:dicarboxylase symporter family transporter [Bryobacteraceae bacterium]|nr:cation:dicarboxylase symporter family transporter [Bryobacteraceae bacterium]